MRDLLFQRTVKFFGKETKVEKNIGHNLNFDDTKKVSLIKKIIE